MDAAINNNLSNAESLNRAGLESLLDLLEVTSIREAIASWSILNHDSSKQYRHQNPLIACVLIDVNLQAGFGEAYRMAQKGWPEEWASAEASKNHYPVSDLTGTKNLDFIKHQEKGAAKVQEFAAEHNFITYTTWNEWTGEKTIPFDVASYEEGTDAYKFSLLNGNDSDFTNQVKKYRSGVSLAIDGKSVVELAN
jgi:hypothetical protein